MGERRTTRTYLACTRSTVRCNCKFSCCPIHLSQTKRLGSPFTPAGLAFATSKVDDDIFQPAHITALQDAELHVNTSSQLDGPRTHEPITHVVKFCTFNLFLLDDLIIVIPPNIIDRRMVALMSLNTIEATARDCKAPSIREECRWLHEWPGGRGNDWLRSTTQHRYTQHCHVFTRSRTSDQVYGRFLSFQKPIIYRSLPLFVSSLCPPPP